MNETFLEKKIFFHKCQTMCSTLNVLSLAESSEVEARYAVISKTLYLVLGTLVQDNTVHRTTCFVKFMLSKINV